MFPAPYDSDKLARVASSQGLLSFQRPGEDRQRLNCTWEQSVKDENSKSAKKKVHCYLSSPGFLHFRGWKWRGGERTITGSGEIENLKRTTHRSENLLSLIALPKGERGRRRKDAIRNLPYLLPAASTNWPICQENFYFSQNEDKSRGWRKVQIFPLDLCPGICLQSYKLGSEKLTKLRSMPPKSLRSPQIFWSEHTNAQFLQIVFREPVQNYLADLFH